jgi:hypothetical protein
VEAYLKVYEQIASRLLEVTAEVDPHTPEMVDMPVSEGTPRLARKRRLERRSLEQGRAVIISIWCRAYCTSIPTTVKVRLLVVWHWMPQLRSG